MRKLVYLGTLFATMLIASADDSPMQSRHTQDTNASPPRIVTHIRILEPRDQAIVQPHTVINTNLLKLTATFDTNAEAFASYDQSLIAAIRTRLTGLLDAQDYSAHPSSGRVALQFKLHPDGSVADLRVLGTTIDPILSLICQKAVSDPVPYPPWTYNMRQAIPTGLRTATLTFTFLKFAQSN